MDSELFVRLGEYAPRFAAATVTTLGLTFASMTLATALGLGASILRQSSRGGRRVVRGYLLVIRNTPELVQLFLVFYALPEIGVTVEPFYAAVLVLGVHYGAYLSEVFRSAIESIERGQWEAAKVLNMPGGVTWRRVILPQAVGRVIPPWGNYVVAMFKITSLTAVITVHEIFYTARDIAAVDFRYFEVFLVAGLIYFSLSFPAARVVHRLERKFGTVDRAIFHGAP